jgi:putative DNA methylase
MPLEAINAEAAREKSHHHGHPSTLHLWWARRPLAACRAVLFGQLVDDPSSIPEEFPTGVEQETERQRLHALICELVKRENLTKETVLNAARREIARSFARRRFDRGEAEDVDEAMLRENPLPKSVNEYLAEKAPPVHDPFCGGSSIPLEAQRLGLRAIASDLNPVAVLIAKAAVELPQTFAGTPPVNPEARARIHLREWLGPQGLAADLRYYGRIAQEEVKKRLSHLYPKVTITDKLAENREDLKPYIGRTLEVAAWLWAHTVACPNPTCGARMPLITTYWLSKNKNQKAWIEPLQSGNRVQFRVVIGKGEAPSPPKVSRGARFRCEICGQTAPASHIKAEGQSKRIGQQLIAIILKVGRGRLYLSPDPHHEAIASAAKPEWRPTQELADDPRNIWCKQYGIITFGDLFTSRQLTLLTTLSAVVTEIRGTLTEDAALDNRTNAQAYSDAIITYLALTASRAAGFHTSLARWRADHSRTETAFGRQAIPFIWDFAESNPFAGAGGDLLGIIEGSAVALESIPAAPPGIAFAADATALQAPPSSVVVSTDPPYYDNISYADLSDYFYVWLRNSLRLIYPTLTETVQTPKERELIAAPYRQRINGETPKEFFENGLSAAFTALKNAHVDDMPLMVYYAFKQAESEEDGATVSSGWDTMLSGLLASGLSVNATWPLRTESTGRLNNIGSNALASSIAITCRIRSRNCPVATRSEFISALKRELPEKIRHLQEAAIAPVDLAQSAIGPGMAVFSSFDKVFESDGSALSVRSALGLINQALDEILEAEEAEYDTDTRWAITWLTQYGFEPAAHGDAEMLSKARNTSVQGIERAGIIEARAGKVRLLKREELGTWAPSTDDRFTIWEACQHLIKTLETEGEAAAAHLLQQLGARSGAARDLAYRLYQHCDRKGDAEEARAYNGLVVAWPRLAALAAEEPRPVVPTLDFI